MSTLLLHMELRAAAFMLKKINEQELTTLNFYDCVKGREGREGRGSARLGDWPIRT